MVDIFTAYLIGCYLLRITDRHCMVEQSSPNHIPIWQSLCQSHAFRTYGALRQSFETLVCNPIEPRGALVLQHEQSQCPLRRNNKCFSVSCTKPIQSISTALRIPIHQYSRWPADNESLSKTHSLPLSIINCQLLHSIFDSLERFPHSVLSIFDWTQSIVDSQIW